MADIVLAFSQKTIAKEGRSGSGRGAAKPAAWTTCRVSQFSSRATAGACWQPVLNWD